MATVRQRIVTQIESDLQTITTGNGYRTSIGSLVSVWRAVPFEPGDAGLDFRDMGGPMQQHPSNLHEQELECEIDVVASGNTSATDIRKMIADVYQLVGTNRRWNDGSVDLARDTKVVDDRMSVVQGDNKVGGATIKLNIIYRTDEFDPDTLA